MITIDIKIYDLEKSKSIQAKYLIGGYDDIFWIDDFIKKRLDEIFIREQKILEEMVQRFKEIELWLLTKN